MIALLRRLDPVLYIDCHVSGGFDMQYDITFTYAGWGRYARHRATAEWLENRFGPNVTAALRKAGHVPTIYPSPVDTREPQRGIRQSPEGPRYSTGYGDFIGVPTVLVENHMLKPYRQRVLGTYVLLEEALKSAARDASDINRAKIADRASRPETLLTRWQPANNPVDWIDGFKGVAFETYTSPASGRSEQRWTGERVSFRMPVIGQEPVETVRLPKAWLVPAAQTEVIDRLKLHGIAFEPLEAEREHKLDRVRVREAKPGRAHDGRIPVEAKFEHETVTQVVPSGTLRIPADQPLGLLAAALLEPESQDSFLAWGFFPEVLSPPPGSEDFITAPIADAFLTRDASARAEFTTKLAKEPGFAADAEARLAWVFARMKRPTAGFGDYPILREL